MFSNALNEYERRSNDNLSTSFNEDFLSVLFLLERINSGNSIRTGLIAGEDKIDGLTMI